MTKIYAHRGFSEKYPENTMLAFRKAAELGVEGLEIDVHLTKDGELVVMHDENTVRTTGVNALIKDLTLEERRKVVQSLIYYIEIDKENIYIHWKF